MRRSEQSISPILTCGPARCHTASSRGCAGRRRWPGPPARARVLVGHQVRRHRRGQPGRGNVLLRPRGVLRGPTDEDMAARRTIIDTDPPEHTKLRKIVASTFSQRAVAVYEHFITGLTEQVLDRMPAGRPGLRLRGRGGQGGPDPGARAGHGPARGRPGPVHRPRRPADRQHRPGDHRRGLGPGRHRRLPQVPVPQPVRQAAVGPGPRGGQGQAPRSPATTCCPSCCGPRWTATGSSETDLDNFFSILVIAGNETTRIAIAQGVLAFAE